MLLSMGANYLSFNENGDADIVRCVDGERSFDEAIRIRCQEASRAINPSCSRLMLDLAILSTQKHPSHQAQFWLGKLAPQDVIQEVALLVSLSRGFDAGTEFLQIVDRATTTAL